MGKDREKQETEYNFDQLLRGSLGCDDTQLLEKMRLAEETVDDSQIPPASEDGFQRVMAEIERRGMKAHYMADKESDEKKDGKDMEKEGGRKIRGVGPLIRVALAVGILATVLLFTSIQAGAKRSYEYDKSIRKNVKNDVALDNEENNQISGDLKNAYKEIHDHIGINVLILGDKPEEMQYEKTAINNRHATMYFDYGGNRFYIIQQLTTVRDSLNIISDRAEYDTVYNEWIKEDVVIEKAVTEQGEEEYSARIIEDDAYYYLSGIMSVEDFKRIVEDIKFME